MGVAIVLHATFVVTGGLTQIPNNWRRCPVCCTGPAARDGDMGLFIDERSSAWWMCQFFEDCAFVYPFSWEEGERRLGELVWERQEFLRTARVAA